MFKLFGKKRAEEPKPESKAEPEKNPELAAFGAQFLPEEITILAVTGADGFGGGRESEDALWQASIGLTAWMEEDDDGPAVRRPARLVALADDKLLAFQRQRVTRDRILRAKVRRAKEDDRFLLVDIPEPAMEPELKAILEEQKKPVTVRDPELGEFALDRSAGWFAAEADWLGQSIQLTFDRDEDQSSCFQTARALMDGQTDWDERVRAYAARELLEQANGWAQDGGENDTPQKPVTREQFMANLEAEAIQVYGDGRFEFWFHDGGLFWGRAIHVSGDLAGGPAGARMEE